MKLKPVVFHYSAKVVNCVRWEQIILKVKSVSVLAVSHTVMSMTELVFDLTTNHKSSDIGI